MMRNYETRSQHSDKKEIFIRFIKEEKKRRI